jgi:hypothetical protein
VSFERALAKLGAGLESVVRTRMFVTDTSRWEEFLSRLAKARLDGDHSRARLRRSGERAAAPTASASATTRRRPPWSR